MRNSKKNLFLALAISFAVFLGGCGNAATEPEKQESENDSKAAAITVSAAASLKDVMAEIKTAFAEDNPKVTITYNFGSSGSLQQQIEQGAEVDVFLSAATKQMDALETKGLILKDTRKNFLQNKMVLIAPKGSAKITSFKELSSEKVSKIGLGEPKSVPAGQYAEQILKNLEVYDSIKPKIVYGNDVRAVLAWVETANVDAGIVYATDAGISNKVRVVAEAPEGSHEPVYYPAAVIEGSKNRETAKDFVTFLYSSKAKPIFEKYGFAFLGE